MENDQRIKTELWEKREFSNIFGKMTLGDPAAGVKHKRRMSHPYSQTVLLEISQHCQQGICSLFSEIRTKLQL